MGFASTKVETHSEVEIDEDEFAEQLTESHGYIECFDVRIGKGEFIREHSPVTFRCMMADEPTQWCCDVCDEKHSVEHRAESCCEQWECDECGNNHDSECEADECCHCCECEMLSSECECDHE